MTRFQDRPVKSGICNGHAVTYVSNQLIVKLKSYASQSPDAHRLVLAALPKKSTLEEGFNSRGRALVRLPDGFDPLEMAQRLASIEEIEFAEPNFVHSGA